jgi:WD40 repeat protein
LSPSGNFLWAGFSDGTMRVFDVGGGFGFQQDSVSPSRQKSHMLVASKWCQSFGAVACQIHARGVHTDLLTHVELAGDYVFAGVQRGAMEMYAVHINDLEQEAATTIPGNGAPRKRKNILDYLQVHVHSDAKLKGFGACCQLQTSGKQRPAYLLLTGKGIKNIHIWKFQPPVSAGQEAIWEQIYDTQTNGNTINLLSFYRSPQGQLLAINKSDSQKLRLWDMSNEEQDEQQDSKQQRPKRPAYQDVANSQAALGIAGGFCVCGGPTMYNQLSIVSLDQPKNAYNHTELALPGLLVAGGGASRRQRRGDLKQVVRVATLSQNASHALLELDDVSKVEWKRIVVRMNGDEAMVVH